MQLVLLASIFVVATCGLVYELVAGTLASYLLGDSITQFSTIIGVYLFSMGIGSWLSRYFNKNLLGWFVQVEILVGIVGGFSSAILFLLFEHVESFRVLLYLLISLTGIMVGMEIPLLMRILKDELNFSDLVSKVFTFDYIGALLASVVFPLLLVPQLGLVRTSFLFGLLNVGVALWVCFYFGKRLPWGTYLKTSAIVCILLLTAGFVMADDIMAMSEEQTYPDKVVYSKSSPYQRIVLTRNRNNIKLYLNGNLQFSSTDEYRYHEALVHPVMQSVDNVQNVLLLGGGDGLAVREVLKYPGVKNITLVDLDAEVTRLFSTMPMLMALNDSALLSPKLTVVNTDAFEWLKHNTTLFDCVIIDFPDPTNYSVGKLYTTAFYRLLHTALAPDGAVVVQCTSPLAAPTSFWCINNTIQNCNFKTAPYHAYVPSFGEWGYIIFSKQPYTIPVLKGRHKYLTAELLPLMFHFPPDMASRPAEVNRLNNQILVHYFEDEWGSYGQ